MESSTSIFKPRIAFSFSSGSIQKSGLKLENIWLANLNTTTATWRERQRFTNHESGIFKSQQSYHIEHTRSRGEVGLKYEEKRKYENMKTLVKLEFVATLTHFRN